MSCAAVVGAGCGWRFTSLHQTTCHALNDQVTPVSAVLGGVGDVPPVDTALTVRNSDKTPIILAPM